MVGEADAHAAPIVAGRDPAGLMAPFTTLALKPKGRGRTAVFEGVAIGLEPLEGQVALHAGGRADAMNAAFLRMDDGIDPGGE